MLTIQKRRRPVGPSGQGSTPPYHNRAAAFLYFRKGPTHGRRLVEGVQGYHRQAGNRDTRKATTRQTRDSFRLLVPPVLMGGRTNIGWVCRQSHACRGSKTCQSASGRVLGPWVRVNWMANGVRRRCPRSLISTLGTAQREVCEKAGTRRSQTRETPSKTNKNVTLSRLSVTA
jgi:hypothetical protein